MPESAGDGGAGRVFFISTVGSVAGVLLTAFLMIPYLTNFRALLGMSLGLGLLVGGITLLNRDIAASREKAPALRLRRYPVAERRFAGGTAPLL